MRIPSGYFRSDRYQPALLNKSDFTSRFGKIDFLVANPTLFPFQLPVMTGDFISHACERLKVVRYGMDDEMLELK